MDPNNPPKLQPHFQRKLLRKEKIIRLSHGQRPTKQNGRNRKGADEYAVEFQSDFTTSSFEEDGHTVKLLVCRFCTNQIIGARSDRIKEHLISQRHRKNKMANGFSTTDLDTQPQLEKLLSLPPGETSSSSAASKSSDDGHKSHKIKINSNSKAKTTVKKKTVDEYATEYHSDFTTNTIEKDGELVHLLVCRYCNCPVGARSDRIKEHLLSKRHLSTKMKIVDTNDSSMPVLTPEVDLDPNYLTQSESSDICAMEKHLMEAMSRDSVPQAEKDPNKTLAKVKLVDVGNMIQECKKCARIILTSNGVKKHKARFSNNFKCSRCSFEGNSADEYWTHLKLHDSLRQCNCNPPSSKQLNSSIGSLNKKLKKKKFIQADLNQPVDSDSVNSPQPAPVLNTQPQPQPPPVLTTAQPIFTQPVISSQPMSMSMPNGQYYATFNSQPVFTGQGGQPAAVMYNTMPLVTQTVFNGQPVYTNTNNPPPELDFEIPQNYIPLSNPMLNQGIRLMENFYELTAGEIKPENYITLQLDFSEY